jgi:hypothetical protein
MNFLVIFLFLIHQSACQPSASRFILNVAHYTLPDLETAENRCVATVITDRHVLTTATCVSVEEFQGVAVVAEVSVLNFTESSKTSTKTPRILYLISVF